MTQAPPAYPSGLTVRPHRGVMILVFGILSLVTSCIVFGIVAWVMGNGDLREMDAGLMDPTGRGMTLAGKICGIVSVAMTVLGLGAFVLLMVLAGFAAAAGAAAGAAP